MTRRPWVFLPAYCLVAGGFVVVAAVTTAHALDPIWPTGATIAGSVVVLGGMTALILTAEHACTRLARALTRITW